MTIPTETAKRLCAPHFEALFGAERGAEFAELLFALRNWQAHSLKPLHAITVLREAGEVNAARLLEILTDEGTDS